MDPLRETPCRGVLTELKREPHLFRISFVKSQMLASLCWREKTFCPVASHRLLRCHSCLRVKLDNTAIALLAMNLAYDICLLQPMISAQLQILHLSKLCFVISEWKPLWKALGPISFLRDVGDLQNL